MVSSDLSLPDPTCALNKSRKYIVVNKLTHNVKKALQVSQKCRYKLLLISHWLPQGHYSLQAFSFFSRLPIYSNSALKILQVFPDRPWTRRNGFIKQVPKHGWWCMPQDFLLSKVSRLMPSLFQWTPSKKLIWSTDHQKNVWLLSASWSSGRKQAQAFVRFRSFVPFGNQGVTELQKLS